MAWPRKFKTYWCVVDCRGTAYLSTARVNRSKSIYSWLNEVESTKGDWRYWKRYGYSCQRVDIKVRNAS